MNHDLLRQIPKVDELLKDPAVLALLEQHSRAVVIEAIRETLEHLRQAILQDALQELSQQDIIERIRAGAILRSQRHLQRVINGAGIIVHTNLGRSNLSQKAIEAVG